jgi:hypothetical protein
MIPTLHVAIYSGQSLYLRLRLPIISKEIIGSISRSAAM